MSNFPGDLIETLRDSLVERHPAIESVPPVLSGDWTHPDADEAVELFRVTIEDHRRSNDVRAALYYRPLTVRSLDLACLDDTRLHELLFNIDTGVGSLYLLQVGEEVGAIAFDMRELRELLHARPRRSGFTADCAYIGLFFALWRDPLGRPSRVVTRASDLFWRNEDERARVEPVITPITALGDGRYEATLAIGAALYRVGVRVRPTGPLEVEDDTHLLDLASDSYRQLKPDGMFGAYR